MVAPAAGAGAGEEPAAWLWRKSGAAASGERWVWMSMRSAARRSRGWFGRRAGGGFGEEARKRRAVGGQRFLVVALDFIIDFLPVDGHFLGRLNADFDHVPLQPDDFHHDSAVNNNAFARFARKYEHGSAAGKFRPRPADGGASIGGVVGNYLLAHERAPVDHHRAFQIHRWPVAAAQSHNIEHIGVGKLRRYLRSTWNITSVSVIRIDWGFSRFGGGLVLQLFARLGFLKCFPLRIPTRTLE